MSRGKLTVDADSGRGSRGQVHTIEGFTAGFIILVAALYGVQAVAITPTSSSTASQEVELNQYKLADDVISTSNSNGELKEALLNWSASDNHTVEDGEFRGSLAETNYYGGTAEGPFMFGAPIPGDFGETLNQTFTQRGLVYNVEIECARDSGGSQTYIDNGDPSLHSVTASTRVALHEHDTVYDNESDNVTLAEVETADDTEMEFYCDRMGSNGDDTSLYNVVEVRLTIWRM